VETANLKMTLDDILRDIPIKNDPTIINTNKIGNKVKNNPFATGID